MSKTFTLEAVSKHNTKSDIYIIIHDKVYDVSRFLQEHPGGEEVLLETAGEDGTEAFEDIGHSDEARGTLEGFLVGDLVRQSSDPVRRKIDTERDAANLEKRTDLGSRNTARTSTYVLVLVGLLASYVIYDFFQNRDKK
jgi:cytochrome b5